MVSDGAVASDATVALDDPVALVNGEELPARVLTEYIDAVRSGIGSQTDAAWEAYLADQGTTPDAYWEALIGHYARQMVVEQRWRELGISASEEEVDERVAALRTTLGASGADGERLWDDYLTMYGYTPESLRGELAYFICAEKLFEAEVPKVEIDTATVERFAMAYGEAGYGVEIPDDGTIDAEALDRDTRDALVAGAQNLAWSYACDLYVDDLVNRAQIEVLVAHQYDVEGQRHG